MPSPIVKDGLAVYSIGEGPPVLWMPYPMAAFVMGDGVLESAIAAFEGCHVITFDPPGAGRSNRRPLLTLDEMSGCAREALEICGVTGPVIAGGHSQGAIAAMHFAGIQPVEALVLAGAALSAEFYRAAKGAIWRSPGFLARAALFAATKRLGAQKILYRYVAKRSFVDVSRMPAVTTKLADWLRPCDVRSGWSHVARTFDVSTNLPTQRCLLLAGKHDGQVPSTCSEELSARLSRARLAVFEGSGHYPFIEEPERFRREVQAFLGEILSFRAT